MFPKYLSSVPMVFLCYVDKVTVIHSATKYIGGHSDMLAGVLSIKDEALDKKFILIDYS